ncbi:MAG: sugar ABC transporter substrate-binding protein [Oscillospiraceae bacterium]|nr:sugar ABC transporter substrate-binding protein [Oscillospiraceae bacterium]
MKKSLAVLLTLCMTVGIFSSCSSTSGNTSSTSDTGDTSDGLKIGVSIADLSNPFYVDIQDGMESAKTEGDELVIMDAAFDAAKQISDIEDMIQQGVDVMCIDPVDSAGIKSSLEVCKSAGIPVIAFNSPVDNTDLVDCTVVSDNYMAGELIGKALAEKLGGTGKIAMLTYDVAVVCYDRAEGFVKALSEYPDMEIVVRQEITPGTDTALPVMENILQSYPEITGVFCLNDPSALGALAAIEAAGKLDAIKVVAVDGSADGKASIAADRLLATAAQHPVDIGAETIKACHSLVGGEGVEAEILIPVELIDATNCNS